jgi:MFS family permease
MQASSLAQSYFSLLDYHPLCTLLKNLSNTIQICISTAFLFTLCSLGTALAPNLAAFFVFRILTAFEGTSFLIVGAACIGDIYRPTERATAMGWFLSGTLIGPAFGPFIGGIIVTYTSWRVLFYLQLSLSALATILSYFLLPETIHQSKTHLLHGLSPPAQLRVLATLTNPLRVLRLFRYAPLVLTSLASSSLVWNMYSLLTPIRYILNPRFALTTPLQSGLFYLAPGCGYICGTFIGGRWADRTTKKWIALRGHRVPEDRLRSALPFLGVVMPGCVLVYGWTVQQAVGGVAVPVICLFVQGVAQLFCFPSLNTYCLDVLPERGAEVIAGNYMVRYLFGALGTAVVLPAVEKIGVGWFSTISAAFMVAAALAVAATVTWGKGWRDTVDDKRRMLRAEKETEEGRVERDAEEALDESCQAPANAGEKNV